MPETIPSKYRDIIVQMIKNSSQDSAVTGENVFQPGNLVNRPYIEQIIVKQLREGSRIVGLENLEDLYSRCRAGRSCLILMEHYSNFDLPIFVYLLEKSGAVGKEIADSLIAIAGFKLNAESAMVRAFTEAYSRIVIYPSRSLDSISDPQVWKEERKKSNAINRAALHEMIRRKHEGHIVLVFPSGTRYRPGRPETRRGLKEIDSYIKAFDCMVFAGSGGNLLHIGSGGAMEEDILAEDSMIFKISPAVDCQEFRSRAHAEAPPDGDAKQFTVDRVMEALENLHNDVAALRGEKI